MSHELVSKVKELAREIGRTPVKNELIASGVSDYSIRAAGGMNNIVAMAGMETYNGVSPKVHSYTPKILVLDIETSQMVAKIWRPGRNMTVPIERIIKDSFTLCWAAKWVGRSEIFFEDLSSLNRAPVGDTKKLLMPIRDLMDEADIILTQNGPSFDIPYLYGRFELHGITPPSSHRNIDTLRISRKFKLASHKLSHMTGMFCDSNVKSSHDKFPGVSLWDEVEAGNKEAMEEMKHYCIKDILSTEELYLERLAKWDRSINFSIFNDEGGNKCFCGSEKFKEHERPVFTNAGIYTRFICKKCHREFTSKENQLGKDKRKALLK